MSAMAATSHHPGEQLATDLDLREFGYGDLEARLEAVFDGWSPCRGAARGWRNPTQDQRWARL